MDSDAIISSALDIYADEMTTSSNLQKLLTIQCSNDEIKNILETLYYNILNIEFNLFIAKNNINLNKIYKNL